MLTTTVFQSIGQTSHLPHPTKSSIRADFKIPNVYGNKVFNSYMEGLADMNVSYQRSIGDIFVYGLGFQYTIIRTDRFYTDASGFANFASPYLRVGLEKFENDMVHWEVTLKGGYVFKQFNSDFIEVDPDLSAYQGEAFSLTPQVGLSLIADDYLTFGLFLSYQFIFAEFSETYIGEDATGIGFTDQDYNRPYQIFAVGLGFTYYLGGKKGGFR